MHHPSAVRWLTCLALLLAPLAFQPSAAAVCVGDCNANNQVAINELIRSVNIALLQAPLSECTAIDSNGDTIVRVNELIVAVNNALFGCESVPTPTFTPLPPTPTPTVLGNLAPQVDAGPDVLTAFDQQPVTLTGSASDDGRPSPAMLTLRWEKISGPGSVTFGSPAAVTTSAMFSAVGAYVIRFSADDGERTGSDEVMVGVDLAAANLAPTLDPIADQILARGAALNLRLIGQDPNPFDALAYSLLDGPTGATVSPDGIFSFAPTALGAHTVSVQVRDPDGLASQRTFEVAVVEGNRPPALGALADAVIPAGALFARLLTATDPDPGDSLTFALLSAPEGMNLAGAQLAWVPGAAQVGTFVVSVQVRDARGAAAQGEFRLVVPSPAAPAARDDTYEVVLGQTLTVPAAGVLANDASVDGSPLSAAQLTPPDKGSVTAFGADGGFTYVAPPALPPPPPLDATVKYQLHYGNTVLSGNHPPLVADVDGDGAPEIIFWRSDVLAVVRGSTGEELFVAGGLPAPHNACALYGRGVDSFAAADIDDDGAVEIVMNAQCAADNFNYIYAAGNATRLVALAYDAEAPEKFVVKWLSDPLAPQVPFPPEQGGDGHLYVPFGGQAAYTAITIARLRPTEMPTVLLGKTYSTHGGPMSDCGRTIPGKTDPHCRIVFALDGATGAKKAPYYAAPEDPASVGAYNASSFGAPAAAVVADVDDDGALDILYQGTLWNVDGTIKRQFDGTAGTASGTADSLLIDLDGDAEMEIVAFDSGNYRRDGFLRAWKADGRLLWKLITPGATVVTRLGAADIDRSGRPTILFAIFTTLFAIDHQGQFKWVRAFPSDARGFHSLVSNGGTVFPVYDLNGDGIVEIVVQYNKSTIEFLRGDTGATQTSWTYPGGFNEGSGSVQAPVIADLDGTGEASLIWYHDVNLNNHSFLQVLKGDTAPWRAAPTHLNQRAFWGTNFNPDGSVPATYPRHTADPRTNFFLQQPPAPYPLEPRLRSQAQFTYAAQDGALASAPATVTIDILPENRPPVVTALPPEALVNVNFWEQPYTFQLAGVDPDPGDVITFAPAEEQPCGFDGRATISPEGLFTLRGRPSDEGQCIFRVTLADGHGGETAASIVIFFTRQTRVVPDVVGEDRSTALNAILSHDLTVAPQIELPSLAPAGEVLAQQPPAKSEVLRGSRVQLTVSLGPGPLDTDADGDGFTPNQGDCDDADPAFSPNLPEVPDNGIDENCDGSERIVAEVRVAPASALRVTSEQVPFTATAVYLDGTSATVTPNWASSAPSIASITAAGVGRALNIGSTGIRATFGGAVGHATFTVADRAAGDQDPPTAVMSTPADGGSVTGLTQITGTAADATFLRYELSLALAGETTFTTIGEGTTAVVDGVLGTLDPTVLLNEHYVLRLTVFDSNGNAETAEVGVLVEGERKIGNFTLRYEDLTVPVSGIPVQVVRAYDSRDKRPGDFGVGWRLDVQTFRASASRVLGRGWSVVKPGLGFVLVPGGDHTVSITLPSGKVERFELQIAPNSSPFVPFTSVRASFVPRPGTLGTLESLDNNELLIVDAQPGPVTLLDDTTLNDYHPDRFRYTAPDGTQYVVTRTRGGESVRDAQANHVTVGPAGITHSAGPGILFGRDAQGRITSVTDPKGQVQRYAYSAAGDLVSHTDAAGNTTQFFYNDAHDVVRIVDPLGRPTARAEYDEDGRLVALTDANGHRTTYAHDVVGRQEVVRDALGRVTVSEYDERGNVLAFTDPLGARTTFTYDERGNELTSTDPLGATTTVSYDAQNNILSIVEPLGQTTTFTRDAAGRPLTITDPRGGVTTNRYDAQGNLLEIVNPLGEVTALTHDGGGNVTSLTDAAGTSTNTFDAAGRRTQLVDPLGMVTTMQYDANGNLLGQQQSQPGADWSLSYDAANRLIGRTFEGLPRTLTYDAVGQIAMATTATGQSVAIASDPVGRLQAIESPTRGTLLRQTYDAVGNRTGVVDVLGNQTRYAYDAADRLITTRHPDGSTEQREYDAAGRPVRLVDARGNATTYEYDLAGRLIAQTDALGGTRRFEHDAAGNQVTETDPAGRITRFAYDALSRPIQTTFADVTTELRAYDAAGRLVMTTDAGGNETHYEYDAAGHLLAVTDPLGKITRLEYDGGGLRTAIVDANGNRTRLAYDGAGRLAQVNYPGGDATASTYDVAGYVSSRTNGAGQTVQYQYNGDGWLTAAVLPGGATETYTYTPDQQLDTVTDARGTTRYDYDPLTRRLTRVTEPDGRYVRYGYDVGGNRTLVAHGAPTTSEAITRYAYDALNRVAEIIHPGGGKTVHAYDAVGNVTSLARPNGVTTQITYDALNRITAIIDRRGGAVLASESYTLDPLGHRTRIDRHDGSRVEYTYDALARVTRERHVDGAAAVTLDASYAYDPAGNLVTAGPATLTYNANNQLVAGGGITYTYDGGGRRVREAWTDQGAPQFVEYGWDARDRLTSYRDAGGAVTTYAYDNRGTRQAKGGAGGAVDFLVDRASPTGYSQIVRQRGPSVERSFVYGSRLLETVDGGVPHYRLFNHIGSTRFETGADGAIAEAINYTAYGSVLSEGGLPHQFAGEERDPESGLTYLRARYYDPATGAFLTRDPEPGNAGDPLSLHRYLYAGANPVNRTDPSGRFTIPEALVSSYQRLQAAGQNVLRARRGLAKAKDVTATTMRVLGGVLSIDAILEAMTNNRRVERWFGGGALAQAYDLAELGQAATGAVELVAAVALGRTAIDMLNGREIIFTIQGFGAVASRGPEDLPQVARNEGFSAHCENRVTARAFAVKPIRPGGPWGIHLCAVFFGQTPMPTAENLTPQGRSSMPGLMVHEFTHVTLSTGDRTYQCALDYRDNAGRLQRGVEASALVPGVNLFVADAYRCWVEDSAIGAPNPNTPNPWGP